MKEMFQYIIRNQNRKKSLKNIQTLTFFLTDIPNINSLIHLKEWNWKNIPYQH